ncbi:hypothetical protein [Magnetovibrio blakemorei]|uniref:Uncharacterized protein n=1 Tax=Magnetovibrio blakemorei TaxID=28181 RepID=A0A1E5Q893_9PROT|nr:hypothetical protein [Magnetovibrio blakemorei]OEJ67584.1 hypothetical protein BEN30_09165 [Magnetovibrio blakemorei]
MANTGKPAWPQTPDGTTDWEVVFEDPQSGFIQLVAQSPSADTLRLTATVVIDKLFTRRGDEVEVARLKNELELILGIPSEISVMQTGVSGLLRQIKETRIEKARVYIERKRSGAAIDRRSGWLWKIDVLLKPKVLLPLGLVFILFISGLVYALLQSTMGGYVRPAPVAEAPAVTPEATPEASAETASKTPPEATPPSQSASQPPSAQPDAASPEGPPTITPPPPVKPVRILLKTMRWPLSSQSATKRAQYYAVVINVANWDDKVEVCRWVPNVMDRLYQAFDRVLPQDRNAQDAELVELQRILPNILNQIFKAPLVSQVDVLRYGDPRFKTATKPPYCTSPDKAQ